MDDEARRRFGGLAAQAAEGSLEGWAESPRSGLALVLLLDQLPRNLHRESAEAFAQDGRALVVARAAVERGDLAALHPVEAAFLLVPFEHAEDLAAQRDGLTLWAALSDLARPEWAETLAGFERFAAKHLEIIERFGRFPHRNQVLERRSTDAERTWLAEGGETFGGAQADSDG